MWKPVMRNDDILGLTAATVGELKRILTQIPDDYMLSVAGDTFGALVDDEEKVILIDEISFLENVLIDQQKENISGIQ